jgi:chemotaxis methyl-accepting protein methylase
VVLRQCKYLNNLIDLSFHQLNFMDDHYHVREMFDVIFCRNVLIYFDRPTQQAVIGKLCRNLNSSGYLFASHSESLSGLDLPLVSLDRRVQKAWRMKRLSPRVPHSEHWPFINAYSLI